MKVYHKYLLYKNKCIHPWMIVKIMTFITYWAFILLIAKVAYGHGFSILPWNLCNSLLIIAFTKYNVINE